MAGFSPEMRFENRPTPTNEVGHTGTFAIPRSNKYTTTFTLATPYIPYNEATGRNQYVVAAVTSGPLQTPASMQHGEVALFRVGKSSTKATVHGSNYVQHIISMSGSGGTVTVVTGTGTTPSAHGFNTGDTVELTGFTAIGTTNLNLYYASDIKVIDANTFTFSFDTTGLGSCASQSECGRNAIAQEGFTLQVGSGRDRIAYPVVMGMIQYNWSYYSNFYAGGYYKFCFNKNVAGRTDGRGNFVYGAWVDCNHPDACSVRNPDRAGQRIERYESSPSHQHVGQYAADGPHIIRPGLQR